MASKTTLQAVDDPSLAFEPINVGGDVVLAQHAEVIRALGKRVVHDVIEIGRRLAEEALRRLREIMGKLKLTVNEEKTRICKVPEGQFDFLGHTFGLMYSARTGKAYLGYRPSKKSIKRMVENIHALTTRSWTWQQTTELPWQLAAVAGARVRMER